MAEPKCSERHGEHQCSKNMGHRGWHRDETNWKKDTGMLFEWIDHAHYKREPVDW